MMKKVSYRFSNRVAQLHKNSKNLLELLELTWNTHCKQLLNRFAYTGRLQ